MIAVISKLSSHRGGLISSLIGEKSVTQRWEVSHSLQLIHFSYAIQCFRTFNIIKKRQQFEAVNLM